MLEGLQQLRSGPEMRHIWEIDGQGGGQDDEQGGQGDGQGGRPPGEEESDDEMNLIKQAQFQEEEEEEEED